LDFPERVYTEDEVRKAKELVDKGYKHSISILGKLDFKQKVEKVLDLIKVAGYYEFFRTYIRSIIEIDGLTQLRQADAAIWANEYAIKNPVDAASLFIQKANSMKEYVDGVLYYGGTAEKRSVEKRIEFLKVLKSKSDEKEIEAECERLLNLWHESSMVY
jgi:hypothetical protein